MNITQLPFNKLIGIDISDNADYLLMLDNKVEYSNHLGNVHAAALYALAEAGSGHFLLTCFPDYNSRLLAVVRKADVKYSGAAIGKIYATADFVNTDATSIAGTLKTKNRILLQTVSQLFDANNKLVMSCKFEWFVTQAAESATIKPNNNQVK